MRRHKTANQALEQTRDSVLRYGEVVGCELLNFFVRPRKVQKKMLPDWDRCFPNCEPIGHHLRDAFQERWVRFHSLPKSKRYPEDDIEYAEVLARHNSILGELAQPDSRVVLVTTGYSRSPMPLGREDEVAVFDQDAVAWRTVEMERVEEGFGESIYWHFFASMWEWRRGIFDRLVRLIADDFVANVLVVATDCRWVLHPYDGGMDVIAESSEARRLLRDRYAAWLSARSDGM